MQIYRFEKLRVYNDALLLVEIVYKLAKELPKDEVFGLTSQLKRACVSVVLNIAEGTGGLGDIEFKSFLRIALKSLYETVAALKIAEKLYKINITIALNHCDIVGKELRALINSLTNEKQKARD